MLKYSMSSKEIHRNNTQYLQNYLAFDVLETLECHRQEFSCEFLHDLHHVHWAREWRRPLYAINVKICNRKWVVVEILQQYIGYQSIYNV